MCIFYTYRDLQRVEFSEKHIVWLHQNVDYPNDYFVWPDGQSKMSDFIKRT